MKNILSISATLLLLSGCQNATYNPFNRSADGKVTQQSQYTKLTQKSVREVARVESVEESRRECYRAIVSVERVKATQYKEMFTMITSAMSDPKMSPEFKMMGIMMFQQSQQQSTLLASLVEGMIGGRKEAPLSCNKMGVYEYKLAMSKNRWTQGTKIAGGLGKLILTGFGIDRAFDLGELTVEKLSESKATAGDNSTILLGNDNDFSPDNSVNNAGGTCSGEIIEGTCITPIIEDNSEPVDDPTEIPTDEVTLEELLGSQ